MQTVKIYAGMTGNFEIIKTDASKELIEKQLKLNNEIENKNETIVNPYDLIESNGYIVEIIGCQDDFDKTNENFDYDLDNYDYE